MQISFANPHWPIFLLIRGDWGSRVRPQYISIDLTSPFPPSGNEGYSMATMVVMEWHLWLNLVDIREEEKNFLLDSWSRPLCYSAHLERWWSRGFREARVQSHAVPCQSKSHVDPNLTPMPLEVGPEKERGHSCSCSEE